MKRNSVHIAGPLIEGKQCCTHCGLILVDISGPSFIAHVKAGVTLPVGQRVAEIEFLWLPHPHTIEPEESWACKQRIRLPNGIKPYVAYGPGFSGSYDTIEEAIGVVEVNGNGAVYELMKHQQLRSKRVSRVLWTGVWRK
jgi:hypothetical protein